MACKDQSISFLKSFGYNVIRLPKADIAPLQIFVNKGGTLQPLGELSTVIIAGNGAGIPPIKKNIPVAPFNGKKTSDLSVGIGLNILGNIIGAMGGGKLGLDVAYKSAKNVVFGYEGVLEDSVEIAQLDQYLSAADVNPLSKHVGELLEADDIFVTTAVIKSDTISVEAKDKSSASLKIDIPVIKEIVGGNVAIGKDKDSETSIVFKGTIPLVFGFKAVRLFYEDGEYKRFDPLKDGGGAMTLSVNVEAGESLFISKSTFVTLGNQ